MAFRRAKHAVAGLIVLWAALCGCHATQHAASPATSTPLPTSSAAAAPPPAPPVHIQPLPVRPVQKSQPTSPNKCPATNAPVPPAGTLTTCDLARGTLYTLGPETLQLGLAHVDAPKSIASGYYEIYLRLDAPAAEAWASYTAAHLHDHVAFVRDDLVLEAPIIEEPVTSGLIALSTQTSQSADQLVALAGRPG